MGLYHYTDAHGLMGIIDKKAFWATDIGFLNDSMELQSGIELLTTRCSKILKECSVSDDAIHKAAASLYVKLPEIIRENLIRRNLYVVSFSKARDNLRQWMAYCPQNSGYAIEFDERKVLITGEKERYHSIVCRLEEVDYQDCVLDKLMSVDSIVRTITDCKFDVIRSTTKIASDLIFHCCAIKNVEFYDECETRLIIQSKLDKRHATNFRSKSGIIIPYFEYPIEHSWITEITIGPNINMKLARRGLEDFLEKKSIQCSVRESTCSLRIF